MAPGRSGVAPGRSGVAPGRRVRHAPRYAARHRELARDRGHGAVLLGIDERDADPAAPGPPGPPDAVHVGVTVVRGVEVDHVGDPGHVDPARGHIGGHEGVDLAGLEPGQGALALALGLVAVHGHRLDTEAAETLHQPVGAVLGAHEHEGERALVLQLGDERLHPAGLADGDEPVLDLGHARSAGRDVLDPRGRVRVPLGRPAGLAVERGGEEEGLTIRMRAGGDDPVHGGPEAHVEHAIGLVEHEHAHAVERERAPGEEILEPARRGHDDVCPRRVAGLLLQPGAAVHGAEAQRPGVADVAQLGHDLLGQLAGGGEHEGGRPGAVARRAIDERDPERQGLAGPGRGLGQQVAAGQPVGDGQTLDGERCGDAAGGEGVDHGAGDAELGEGLL